MIRVILCVLAGLAVYAAGFFLITAVILSSRGIAGARSDLFADIMTGYALAGLPICIVGALWFARRTKPPPRPEPPSG